MDLKKILMVILGLMVPLGPVFGTRCWASEFPKITELQTRVLSKARSFDPNGKDGFLVYNIIPHFSQALGEDFYSWRFFEAWALLSPNLPNKHRVSVNCDEMGRFWAVNVPGKHWVMDAVKKKFLYQEERNDSGSDQAYRLEVSPKGRFVIQTFLQEGGGESFGKVIEISTGKALPCHLVELDGIFFQDRYILGQFEGKKGRLLYDTVKDRYREMGSDFSFDTSAVVCLSDGMTLFGFQAGNSLDFYLWKMPGLKKTKWVYEGPGLPFTGSRPDVVGINEGEALIFCDLGQGTIKRFRFVGDEDHFQPEWIDEGKGPSKGAPQKAPQKTKFKNFKVGAVSSSSDSPHLVEFPDRAGGFWIFAASYQKWGEISRSTAIHLDSHWVQDKILRYDRALQVNGWETLCRLSDDQGSVWGLDREGNLIEFPLR